MLFIPKYGWAPYYDGSRVPVCLMPADTLWRELFFYLSSSLFFWVPLVVLLILYSVIAVHLMADPGIKVRVLNFKTRMAALVSKSSTPAPPSGIYQTKLAFSAISLLKSHIN